MHQLIDSTSRPKLTHCPQGSVGTKQEVSFCRIVDVRERIFKAEQSNGFLEFS